MPVFCWTALAPNLLIVAAFPILTATFMMLLLDRYLGMHFFTNDAGGNPMMYAAFFWTLGKVLGSHPYPNVHEYGPAAATHHDHVQRPLEHLRWQEHVLQPGRPDGRLDVVAQHRAWQR
jgi:cytochrome c/quinol oxidase subunit I